MFDKKTSKVNWNLRGASPTHSICIQTKMTMERQNNAADTSAKPLNYNMVGNKNKYVVLIFPIAPMLSAKKRPHDGCDKCVILCGRVLSVKACPGPTTMWS